LFSVSAWQRPCSLHSLPTVFRFNRHKDFFLRFGVLQGARMPTYQNTLPPTSLSSGDIGFSFNNEPFPGAGTSGSQFALPSYTGLADGGTAVRWQTIFGGAPSAGSIVLQSAINDVDAEYQTIDTTTATTGEGRSLASVQARFLRAKVVSSTGGSGLTVKILV
jgi:hypothetical protein